MFQKWQYEFFLDIFKIKVTVNVYIEELWDIQVHICTKYFEKKRIIPVRIPVVSFLSLFIWEVSVVSLKERWVKFCKLNY